MELRDHTERRDGAFMGDLAALRAEEGDLWRKWMMAQRAAGLASALAAAYREKKRRIERGTAGRIAFSGAELERAERQERQMMLQLRLVRERLEEIRARIRDATSGSPTG